MIEMLKGFFFSQHNVENKQSVWDEYFLSKSKSVWKRYFFIENWNPSIRKVAYGIF